MSLKRRRKLIDSNKLDGKFRRRFVRKLQIACSKREIVTEKKVWVSKKDKNWLDSDRLNEKFRKGIVKKIWNC